ncbi:MAG TPA: NAD-dependent epimerase/dehydratase family protein [Pararhizobium sp.]|nr:NAD-dependent epimerase/dehydratase family protein [Pararhizobium sp.]
MKTHAAAPSSPAVAGKVGPVLITGGSGFIGSNLADSLLSNGGEVVVLDNLSRPGVEQNLAWLKERHGTRVHPLIADIRDPHCADPVIGDVKAVFHLAAQTAVTTSMENPADDFEVNARGTFNILEAVRASGRRMPVVLSSTNKVYGGLEDLKMMETADRFLPADRRIREHGIGEDRSLDFCTPYGCSKGVADQYVLDYSASFGLPTAVLRMSCIYGPRQFGTEDQGWVAHFLIKALAGEPITIFGNGKQVRDILHVHDAVAAYRAVLQSIESVNGRAFNLGGGPANAVSLRQLLREISRLTHGEVEIEWSDSRPGDQVFFVADTRRIRKALGWHQTLGWQEGLRDLADWLVEERSGKRLGSSRRMTA